MQLDPQKKTLDHAKRTGKIEALGKHYLTIYSLLLGSWRAIMNIGFYFHLQEGTMEIIIIVSLSACLLITSFLWQRAQKQKNELSKAIQYQDIANLLYENAFSDTGFTKKLENISHVIMGKLKFDYVSFFVIDESLTVASVHSNVPSYDQRDLHTHAAELLKTKTAPQIQFSHEAFLPYAESRYIKYMYYIPLVNAGRVIGGVILERDNLEEIDKIESIIFKTIISAVAKAFSFIVYAYNLNESAHKDFMTGTLNRTSYEEINTNLEGNYTVVMCDIDHFKKVNDTYGHDVGDIVIKMFAKHLLKSVRFEDRVFRLGGEEFMLLLKDVDVKLIQSRIDLVREEISRHTVEYQEQSIKITASFGLTDTSKSNNLTTLVKQADIALYYSKQYGRNRCTIFKDNLS